MGQTPPKLVPDLEHKGLPRSCWASSTICRIHYNEINPVKDIYCAREASWHDRYIDTLSYGKRQRYNSPSADLVHDLHDSLDIILGSTSGFRAHRPRHHAGTTTTLLLLLLCAGKTTTGRINSFRGRAEPPFGLWRGAFRGPGTLAGHTSASSQDGQRRRSGIG